MTTIVPITAELEHVTPELAADWLGSNTKNRNISRKHVEMLARDMAAGSWHASGEGIQFASDGTLLDGQHRLSAVVQSCTTVPLLVVRGVAHEAQHALDTGRKRSAADALAISGRAYSRSLASAAKILMGYPFPSSNIQQGNLTVTEVLEFIDAHPGLDESARFGQLTVAHQTRGWTPCSVLSACHYLVAPSHREMFEVFCAKVFTGVGVEARSPELALIRFCQDAATSRKSFTTAGVHYVVLASAFGSRVAGQERTHLRMVNAGSKMPLIAGVSEVPSW